MTSEQKNQIANLRQQGLGYATIAQALGISKSTVTSHCQRNNLGGIKSNGAVLDKKFCKHCGKEMQPFSGRKQAKFCCKKCRVAWWNANQEKVNKKAYYTFVCSFCKKPFSAYGNSKRKYCSHSCYINARFKGGEAID